MFLGTLDLPSACLLTWRAYCTPCGRWFHAEDAAARKACSQVSSCAVLQNGTIPESDSLRWCTVDCPPRTRRCAAVESNRITGQHAVTIHSAAVRRCEMLRVALFLWSLRGTDSSWRQVHSGHAAEALFRRSRNATSCSVSSPTCPSKRSTAGSVKRQRIHAGPPWNH